MNLEKFKYKIALIHLLMGFIAFVFPPIFVIYPFIVFFYGFKIVGQNSNRNHEALFFAAYFVGLECFLRMTKSLLFYETGKYGVIVFMILGMVYQKFYSKTAIYFFVLVLFLPGIITALPNFTEDSNVRKQIIFNLSGPLTLIITAIYCFDKQISIIQFKNTLYALGFSLISTLVYVFLYNFNKEIFVNTEANSAASGGFGPNQVATIFGLGCLVFFILFLYFAKSKIERIIFLILSFLFIYRSLLTFSRGGTYTGIACIAVLLFYSYFKIGVQGKLKIKLVVIILIFSGFGIFSYSITQTDGLLLKRYSGKDAMGREKADKFSGRKEIAETELEIFKEHPIFGCGIGLNLEVKKEMSTTTIDTHNEITRLLAEQGVFGVLIFLISFITPILYLLANRQQIFALAFFVFWLLTINHAAMRLAAPGFIYALSLLKIDFNENNIIYRK